MPVTLSLNDKISTSVLSINFFRGGERVES
jgi:hypothetical protein